VRVLVVAVAVSGALFLGAGAAGQSASSATTGYVVVLSDDVRAVEPAIERLATTLGVRPTYRYRFALKGFAAALTAEQAAELGADPDVSFVSLDRRLRILGTVPIKAGEEVPAGARRIESARGDRIQKRSRWGVAMIDTGVDVTHPDLNATAGKDCVDAEPPDDDNGHGTHLSGTVGARNQGAGVVGVSPTTMVYAVKSFDATGSGTDASVICGIDWVTQRARALRIKVANMSWGGPDDGDCGSSNGDALHKAICRLVVTAMADTDGAPGGLGPACNLQPDDRYASYSNFTSPGSEDAEHTVAAPGVCILSTRPGGGHVRATGTSMAVPHVSGTVANCLGHRRQRGPCAGLTVPQIIQRIRADAAARPPAYGFTGDPGHGPPPGRYYGFLVSNLGY
jgi:subtilisin